MSARTERRSSGSRIRESTLIDFPRPGVAHGRSPFEVLGVDSIGWRVADATLATGLIICVVTVGNLTDLPSGLANFFEIHLTVRSALLLAALAFAWPCVLSVCGLYVASRMRTGRGEWSRIALASAIGAVLALAFPLTRASGAVRPIHALIFGALIAPATAGLRLVGRALQRRTRFGVARNVVIVGSGPRARATYHELSGPGTRYNILGFVDDLPGAPETRRLMSALGTVDELEAVLTRFVVDEVWITLPVKSCYDAFQHVIAVCERSGVDFSYALDPFRHAQSRPRLSDLDGRSVVNATPITEADDLVLKRVFDIAVAVSTLAFLSPLILLIAAIVRLTSRGPILFAQERYGKRKRLFVIYKFRTMRVDAEAALHGDPRLYEEYRHNNFKLSEDQDPRLTFVGRFLRKSSLDELPQLWNVLRGDMSIVGPRPIVPDEMRQYGGVASLLLALKPGITNMWVIEGWNAVGYPRRAELELKYVRDWSLRRDLWILLRTLPAVLRRAAAR